MSERDFWISLEFRLCGEFAGMAERKMHYIWCDGFLPNQYFLESAEPKITGKVWIVHDQHQSLWDFTLFLPQPISSREAIDWAKLLPADDVTRWMAYDPVGQQIQIEPAVAVPDLI